MNIQLAQRNPSLSDMGAVLFGIVCSLDLRFLSNSPQFSRLTVHLDICLFRPYASHCTKSLRGRCRLSRRWNLNITKLESEWDRKKAKTKQTGIDLTLDTKYILFPEHAKGLFLAPVQIHLTLVDIFNDLPNAVISVLITVLALPEHLDN